MSGYNKLFLIIEFGKERRLNLFFCIKFKLCAYQSIFWGKKLAKDKT